MAGLLRLGSVILDLKYVLYVWYLSGLFVS